MSLQDHSDSELLGAYMHGGVEEAFSELFSRHGAMVRGVCQRVSGTEQDSDEVVQIVFATLARRGDSLSDRPNLAGWLHRAALHTALRGRRDAAVRRAHERAAARLWAAEVPVQPASTLEREADCLEVQQAINAIPDPFRVVLILHYLEGRPIRDIAVLLGCAHGTAASRLSRGREMLRNQLRRRDSSFGAAALGALLGTDYNEPAPEAKPQGRWYPVPGDLLPRCCIPNWQLPLTPLGSMVAWPGLAAGTMTGMIRRWIAGTTLSTRCAMVCAALGCAGSVTAAANPAIRNAVAQVAANFNNYNRNGPEHDESITKGTKDDDGDNKSKQSGPSSIQRDERLLGRPAVAPEPGSLALLSATAVPILLRRRSARNRRRPGT